MILIKQEEHSTANGPYVIMVWREWSWKNYNYWEACMAFKQDGKKVVIGAADTFRAAAVDQLKIWETGR